MFHHEQMPEPNSILHDSEVRAHLEQLRVNHARMLCEPRQPLRTREQRMRSAVQRKPRPPKKISTTIRLCPEVLAAFKADGAGWQTRINEALRQAVASDATSPCR